MPGTQNYAEFVATLSAKDKAELEKLTTKVSKQAAEGTKASVAAGETLLAVRSLLAKVGAKGQFSNYCREQKIVRQTAYNWIRAYQWEKLVPAEFKAVAEQKQLSLDEVTQNKLIGIALRASPGTVDEAEKKLAEDETKEETETSDPLADAIKKAARLIIVAFQGKLEAAEALAGIPRLKDEASTEVAAVRSSADMAIEGISIAVGKGLLDEAAKHRGLRPFAEKLLAPMNWVPQQLKHENPPTA
jgi:hypothetical protein